MLQHFKKGTKAYEKQEAALNRAVRCGGRVEFWMSAEYGVDGSTGVIETALECRYCREQVHEIKMDAEIVGQWIQERLDRIGA